MKRIVLDTNCLLMSLPKNSPYREIWNAFLDGRIILCVSNDAHFRVLKSNTFPRVNIINLKSFLKVMQMNKPYCIDSETEEMLNEAEVEYKTLGRNM